MRLGNRFVVGELLNLPTREYSTGRNRLQALACDAADGAAAIPRRPSERATDRGGAIAPLDDAGAATGALMPTICVVPRLERNQGGSAQRGLDGSTEATLVCPVTHHCGGSGGRRGTPLMHLQLPHHMNDADVTDVHICTGSYSTRY